MLSNQGPFVSLPPQQVLIRSRRWLDVLDMCQLKSQNEIDSYFKSLEESIRKGSFIDRILSPSIEDIENRHASSLHALRNKTNELKIQVKNLHQAAKDELVTYISLETYLIFEGHEELKYRVF